MTSPAPVPAPKSGAVCPSCQTPASGKFCSNCGAPLAGALCAACGTDLTPGAKFCHRCGAPSGAKADSRSAVAGTDRGLASALPWAVAAIALLAFIALVAGQHFSRSKTATEGAPADLPAAAQSGGAPPDISQMTPEERAERLYDRVMALNERGRPDSVRFFAPMAMQAYRMLGALNADQRYDLGRIAAVAGDAPTARAEADSILASQPQHLLGLLLAADAARARGDQGSETSYLRRFVAAEPAERAKQLPEYQQHANEIDNRLAKARAR
jgi:hypothetical protein